MGIEARHRLQAHKQSQRIFSAGQTAIALTKEEQSLITEVYGKEALEKTIFRMHYGRLEQVLETYIGTDLGVLNLPPFLFCPETESYLLVCETVPALRRPEILTANSWMKTRSA